jgi:hypothetical protein
LLRARGAMVISTDARRMVEGDEEKGVIISCSHFIYHNHTCFARNEYMSIVEVQLRSLTIDTYYRNE